MTQQFFLPQHTQFETTFTGKKLNSCFSKDKTSLEHQHDLIYYVNCTKQSCLDKYVGEIGSRIIKRLKDHSGRDHPLHMLKHNIEASHTDIKTADFKMIDMNFSNNKRKQKKNCRVFMDQRPETYIKCNYQF